MSSSHKERLGQMTGALNSTILQSSDNLKTHVTTQSSLLESTMRQHLNAFATQIKSCPNASSQKLETMMTRIGQLQNQFTQHITAHGRVQEVTDDVEMSDLISQNTSSGATDSLDASLDRLFNLASDRQSTVYSSEAQKIIDDIEQMLQLVTNNAD